MKRWLETSKFPFYCGRKTYITFLLNSCGLRADAFLIMLVACSCCTSVHMLAILTAEGICTSFLHTKSTFQRCATDLTRELESAMDELSVSSPHPLPEDGIQRDWNAKSRQPVGIVGGPPPYEPLASLPLRRLPYTYEELQYSGGFRTVDIYPGDPDNPVVCDIASHQLIVPDQYDALSYTWGDAIDQQLIYPDGGYGELPVTSNCFNAMRRLRNKYEPRRVWIDAVCINQDDLEERNRQVSIMGSIYKSARRVYIYLGEEDLHSRVAMSYLQSIEKHGIQFHTPTTMQELTAMQNFLARPWFTRIWVLQEVYQAKEAIIICGGLRVSWAAIQSLRGFEYLRERRLSHWPYVTTVKDRKVIRSHLLHKLLVESRVCHATDPRDKLYALLPLLSDAKESGLAADYAVSRPCCFITLPYT